MTQKAFNRGKEQKNTRKARGQEVHFVAIKNESSCTSTEAAVVKLKARMMMLLLTTVGNFRFITCQPGSDAKLQLFYRIQGPSAKRQNSPFPMHPQCKYSVPITALPYGGSLATFLLLLWLVAFTGHHQQSHHSKHWV